MDEEEPTTDQLAALHRLVGLPPPRTDRAGVATRTGVDDGRSARWWRAMGFPVAPDGEVVFSSADVDLVRRLEEVLDAGLVDEGDVLRLARVMGGAFARVADAQVATLDDALRRAEPDGPATTAGRLTALLGRSGPWELAVLEESLVYVWRRHLLAALGRAVASADDDGTAAVGFVDIVRFTRLAAELDDAALGEVVDEFEAAASDAVAAHGGRVVKFLGDEVLFVAADLGAAVDVALDLVAHGRDAGRPSVRCGVAWGPTVGLGGDVFGPTVNLASRLTAVARPDRVVVPIDVLGELDGRDDLVVRRVGRAYDLKGIGPTRIASVGRPDGSPP